MVYNRFAKFEWEIREIANESKGEKKDANSIKLHNSCAYTIYIYIGFCGCVVNFILKKKKKLHRNGLRIDFGYVISAIHYECDVDIFIKHYWWLQISGHHLSHTYMPHTHTHTHTTKTNRPVGRLTTIWHSISYFMECHTVFKAKNSLSIFHILWIGANSAKRHINIETIR